MPNPTIEAYVKEGTLTQAQADNLTPQAKAALTDRRVVPLLDKQKITVEQLINITPQANRLLYKLVPNVLMGQISVEKILNAAKNVDSALTDPKVRGWLSLDEILDLSEVAAAAFNSLSIQFLKDAGKITIKQIKQLTHAANEVLSERFINESLRQGLLAIEPLLSVTNDISIILTDPDVLSWIKAGNATFDQILNLSEPASLVLSHFMVRGLMQAGQLSLDQVLNITAPASAALVDPGVLWWLEEGAITMAQVLAITAPASDALCNWQVRRLVPGVITVEQLLNLTEQDLLALQTAIRNEEIVEWLLAGDLTLQAVLEGGFTPPAPMINTAQSTHTASVHQSASESAKRLEECYGLALNATTFANFKDYLASLPDSLKNRAALRGFNRLTALDQTFVDPGSGIGLRRLVGLVILAMNDAGRRVGTLDDARSLMVQALYEIQREYNLSAAGVDDQQSDDEVSCPGGAFNKFIEKMHGVLPDCRMVFITQATASLKFPIVIREEARRYLKGLANPGTEAGAHAFADLMANVENEGVSFIWAKIKSMVASRMFDEFGSLYTSVNDPKFLDFIAAGEYTPLGDLRSIKETFQSSEGYSRFCRRSLLGVSMFNNSVAPFNHRNTASRYLEAGSEESKEEVSGLRQ